MREIKLRVSMDGDKVVNAQIDDIGDGLHDLAVRDARAAKQALDGLDHTTLNQVRSQVTGMNQEVIRSAGIYQDAAGKWRNASGQFVTSAKLAELGIKNFGGEVVKSSVTLKSYGEELQRLGSQFQNFGGQVQGFGQTLTVGVSLPIIGLGVAAIKTFADVQSAVAEISTIKPQINTDEVTKALYELSTRVPQTAEQLGAGLYNIFSSIEVTQGGALKLLETFAKGATAAKTDTQTFGTAVLGVMNAYKLSVDDAAQITDVFFNTINLGVVNGQELAGSLGVVTQAAKNAGVNFNELGALIVGVTKEGGDAGQNINNLANFLQKLPTKEASAAFKKLGVDVQIGGKFRPVLDILGDLQTKLKSMSESDAAQALQEIFPDAQARTGVQTLLSQLDAVREALKLNKETAGAADAAYKKIAVTANVQFMLLKNTVVAILSELGSAILPIIQPLVIWLASNLIPAVKQAVETFKTWSPQMQQVALAVVGFIAALGPALVIIGTVVTGVGAFVAALGAIAGVIGTIGLAPIIAGIAAAAVVIPIVLAEWIAIAALLYQAWQTNFGGIRELTATVAQAVQNGWSQMMESIRQLTADVTAQISQFWAENGEDIKKAVGVVSDYIKATWQSVVAFWQENGETIKSYTSAAWSQVRTIVVGAITIILSTIKLIAAVINGDWAKAFSAAKTIVGTVLSAIISILKNGVVATVAAVRLLFSGIWSLSSWVGEQAVALGKNLVLGIINGIGSLGSALWEKGKSIVSGLLDSMRSEADVQSPSKKTIEIGRFISEGLAIGLESRMSQIRAAAKKASNEAIEEFQKLAGASAEVVKTFQMIERVRNAASGQQEIIKLRDELKVNNGLSLPSTVVDTESELSFLRQKKSEVEKLDKSLDDLAKSYKDLQDAQSEYEDKVANNLKSIENAGEINLLNIQEEAALLGVTDELEQQKVRNYFNIQRLRQEMLNDGYGQKDIDNNAEALRLEQARVLEWIRMNQIRKQTIEADSLGKDLLGQLSQLQNGNKELSVYEQTLKKINTSLTEISPQEKERLLTLAQAVDGQKQYNEQWNKTYDFIRNSFDILFDTSTSFKDKLKSIFGDIFNSFKQMVLKMVATWATNSIMGGQSSGGGILGNIFGSIFGGGGGAFGSGNSSAITNFTGSNGGSQLPTAPNPMRMILQQAGIINGGGGQVVGQANPLAGLFSAQGISSAIASGGITAAIALAQYAFTTTSPLKGLATGGLLGFLSGTLRRNSLRKKEEKSRTQYLVDAFDALKQFDSLIGDVRTSRIDGAAAISQGTSLGAQIRSQYLQSANSLTDKKTRNIALKDVSRIDAIIRQKMDELRGVAERAEGAAAIDKRILPEFATGNYFADHFKPNGLIPGVFDGKDDILALISRGELILNENQRQKVIRNAGGVDVFSNAGIPNYPNKSQYKTPKFESGAFLSNTSSSFSSRNSIPSESVQPINIYISNEFDAEGIFQTGVKTDSSKRVLVEVINEERKDGTIK